MGKIILAVSLFICLHFIEGGLPPNSCAERNEKLKIKNVKLSSLGICADFSKEVTEKKAEDYNGCSLFYNFNACAN